MEIVPNINSRNIHGLKHYKTHIHFLQNYQEHKQNYSMKYNVLWSMPLYSVSPSFK